MKGLNFVNIPNFVYTADGKKRKYNNGTQKISKSLSMIAMFLLLSLHPVMWNQIHLEIVLRMNQ